MGPAFSSEGPAACRGAGELWISPGSRVLAQGPSQRMRRHWPGSGEDAGRAGHFPAGGPGRRLQGAGGQGLPLRPSGSSTASTQSTRTMHASHRAHGTHALNMHTHAPVFCGIRFTEEKTSVTSTVKLCLKNKFCAYLPASLFFPYSHSSSFIYHCFKFHISNSNIKTKRPRVLWAPLHTGRAVLPQRELIPLFRLRPSRLPGPPGGSCPASAPSLLCFRPAFGIKPPPSGRLQGLPVKV